MRALHENVAGLDVQKKTVVTAMSVVDGVLEGTFSVMLVNAKHIKHVTGRKMDVKDVQWIAEFLQHGLLKASFIPERAQRELRERIRYRTTAGTLLRSQPPAEGPGRCQSQAGVGRHRCAGRVRSSHD